ncbi:drug resistance transporter Bcr/CflA subfamily domain protein, partial [Vibrio cholerae CP1050(23)]
MVVALTIAAIPKRKIPHSITGRRPKLSA